VIHGINLFCNYHYKPFGPNCHFLSLSIELKCPEGSISEAVLALTEESKVEGLILTINHTGK